MNVKLSFLLTMIFALALAVSGCTDRDDSGGEAGDDDPLNVLTTTTWLRDAAENVAGDVADVDSLMGPGIDPHAYVASESDVTRLEQADIILYNGLFLEGAMSDVLARMEDQVHTVAIAEQIDSDLLLEPDLALLGEDFDAPHDPHIWFDVSLWKMAVEAIRDELIDIDPDNEDTYRANTDDYLAELDELDQYIRDRLEELPEHQRVLITAHDAFGYLGKAYDFEVLGLQPLTTDVEAGASDIREMADLIVEREIRTIFMETSVPPQGVEAVHAAARDRGFDVEVADAPLYGDALGDPGTEQGTYVGATRFNIDLIIDALKTD